MGQDPGLLSELLAAERIVWDALVSGDAEAEDRVLADDFLGVYPDGFAGKADHVGQLANGPTVASYRLSDARVMPLGSSHAMLCYLAAYTRPGCKEEAMYVSSVWQRRTEGWINIFSQDTPATGKAVP